MSLRKSFGVGVIVGALVALGGCSAEVGETPELEAAGEVAAPEALIACGGTCRWGCDAAGACVDPVAVVVGAAHSCALREDGGVDCWGAGRRGELGDGTGADRATPGAAVIAGAVAIDAGDAHTCALLEDGSVACWGANDAGQAGDGSVGDRATPTRVLLPGRAVEIAAGGASTCARGEGGEVWCWGANDRGQLGDGTRVGRSVPAAVRIAAAVDLDVGRAHACAVLAGDDGHVACWGANDRGQVGDASWLDREVPIRVMAIGPMRAVRLGDDHSCAIDGITHAICWGAGDRGQLADPTLEDREMPAIRHTSVVAIGGDRTCGRIDWGELGCWGEGYGASKVMIENLMEASVVAIGAGHGCAVHPLLGGVRCWGDNGRGQLGDGTSSSAAIPVDAARPAR